MTPQTLYGFIALVTQKIPLATRNPGATVQVIGPFCNVCARYQAATGAPNFDDKL